MKPVLQNRVHPKIGNCASACIASIFELPIEQVFDGDPEDCAARDDGQWYAKLKEWLLARNLMYMPVKMAPHGYSIAIGPSPRIRNADGSTTPHACIALDGNLVHDPHPDATFFAGKEQYEYWIFYLVDPLKPAKVNPGFVEGPTISLDVIAPVIHSSRTNAIANESYRRGLL